MEIKDKTIFIPEGNSFILAVTITGIQSLEGMSGLRVYASSTPNIPSAALKCTYSGNVIKIPFESLKQGEYNLWIYFTKNGQKMSFNYKALLKIVPWSNRFINWEDYKEGSTIAISAGVAIVTEFSTGDWAQLLNTIEHLEDLEEDCQSAATEAHDAAEYAKQEGDYAKEIGEDLLKAKERGDFKGEKGEKGDDGLDGQDGKDGTILYPKMRLDADTHLICGIPDLMEEVPIKLNENNGHIYMQL